MYFRQTKNAGPTGPASCRDLRPCGSDQQQNVVRRADDVAGIDGLQRGAVLRADLRHLRERLARGTRPVEAKLFLGRLRDEWS